MEILSKIVAWIGKAIVGGSDDPGLYIAGIGVSVLGYAVGVLATSTVIVMVPKTILWGLYKTGEEQMIHKDEGKSRIGMGLVMFGVVLILVGIISAIHITGSPK